MRRLAWRLYLGVGALATGAYHLLPYNPAGAVLNLVVGDVLGGQSAAGQGVGQPHDRVVLTDVEGLEPLAGPGARGHAASTSGSPMPRPLLAAHTCSGAARRPRGVPRMVDLAAEDLIGDGLEAVRPGRRARHPKPGGRSPLTLAAPDHR